MAEMNLLVQVATPIINFHFGCLFSKVSSLDSFRVEVPSLYIPFRSLSMSYSIILTANQKESRWFKTRQNYGIRQWGKKLPSLTLGISLPMLFQKPLSPFALRVND